MLYVNIINYKKILTFLILRRGRINEGRVQSLYLTICEHIIRARIQDNTFFRHRMMNINMVKLNKCD